MARANRLDHPAQTRPIAADHPRPTLLRHALLMPGLPTGHAPPTTTLSGLRAGGESRPSTIHACPPWTIARRCACGVVLENGRPNPPCLESAPASVPGRLARDAAKWRRCSIASPPVSSLPRTPLESPNGCRGPNGTRCAGATPLWTSRPRPIASPRCLFGQTNPCPNAHSHPRQMRRCPTNGAAASASSNRRGVGPP